jgi:hypothetical protein
MLRLCIFFIGILTILGCQAKTIPEKEKSEKALASKKANPVYQPSFLDAPLETGKVRNKKKGNLVCFWVTYAKAKKEIPVVLEKQYGMFILWQKQEKNGKTVQKKRFYFFDNRRKKYFGTQNFNHFLFVLKSLPRNTFIDWINTCQVSSWSDMPSSEYKKLEKVLLRGKLKQAGVIIKKPETEYQPFFVCLTEYGEDGKFKYLKLTEKDTQPPRRHMAIPTKRRKTKK